MFFTNLKQKIKRKEFGSDKKQIHQRKMYVCVYLALQTRRIYYGHIALSIQRSIISKEWNRTRHAVIGKQEAMV